jgi:oxygen-independent coproporphyrinogen-3 oxidase
LHGIYLHIPFCKQACTYCDFYFSTNLRMQDEVTAAICTEIDLRRNYLQSEEIGSLYFGGGTPSLLTADNLQRLFAVLQKHFRWDPSAEITFEVNPDDVTAERLSLWKKLGINRLSIGLQSFMEEELRWMNRAHTAEESLTAVKMAQDAGFSNLSIDLIYGSKFQDLKTWERTLNTALGLDVQHISSYNLTIEPGTVLGLLHKKGKEPEVFDELSNDQFRMMAARLKEAGFIHYEISNFGRPGHLAVHNTNYWLQQPYLGLGPSAHSFDGSSRQWNVRNNSVYVRAMNEGGKYFDKEILSVRDRYNEYVLTRLRTIWGCDLNEINEKFGPEFKKYFLAEVNKKSSSFIESNGVFTLTEEARSFADGIASALFFA